jgi:hypothetical protein
MEVIGDKKSIQISSGISPLFFHIILYLIQALVTTYDEILQALVVEGDVLLLEPFLDPTSPTVQARLGPFGLSQVWQTEKTSMRLAISI